MTTHVGSRVGPVTRRCGLLALRPARLLALTNKVLLLSSFRRVGHPIPTSTITTRASSQFPRPDSHRQDTPPYGLRQEAGTIAPLLDIPSQAELSLSAAIKSIFRKNLRTSSWGRARIRGAILHPSLRSSNAVSSTAERTSGVAIRQSAIRRIWIIRGAREWNNARCAKGLLIRVRRQVLACISP